MFSILKQTSWLILAQITTKVIGFFYTIFLARSLGVENFGLFSLSLAYFSLISTLSDLGLNKYLSREIARERKRDFLFYKMAIFRLTVSAVLFAGFSLFFYLFDNDKIRVYLILLGILSIIPFSLSQTVDAVFIALKKLERSALGLVILSLSTTLLGLFLVLSGFGAAGALLAMLVGQLIYASSLFILVYSFKIHPDLNINARELVMVLKDSLPYGLLGILGLLYFKVDILMINYLRGNFETGIYSAAYKFLEAVIFIPNSLSLALFPVLSKMHDVNPKNLKPLFGHFLKLSALVGLFFLIIYMTVLPLIIRWLLPNYLPSVGVIQVLALSIPFLFMYIPASQVVLSSEKYLKPVILLSLIPLSFNVITNWLFIPLYGYTAAAWTTVASDVVSFSALLIYMQRSVFHYE